jgi:tripartite-type tricarboxylate transporter receptor subunit TctC
MRQSPSFTGRSSRRTFLRAAAGVTAAVALPHVARAQAWPSRPITLLVFVPAGGTPDIIARLIGQALGQRLGQPIVIDNRPGAGGNLALQAVARAPADGYTLLLVATPHAVNVTLYEKSPVAVTRDLVPIVGLNRDYFALAVNPAFQAKTVADYIAYAKANPGKLNVASSGSGNLTHLSAELFRMSTGIDVVHVPYRGTPAAQAAIMAGEAHATFDALAAGLPQIQGGRMRALGVSAPARLRVLPDVPTIAETVPGYAVTGWLGLGAPKGTPPEIVERLARETNAVLADPAMQARLAELGSEPMPGSTADFAKLVADETEKWSKVVKFAGLKVD